MTMTETAPPQEKPNTRSSLGHLTDRVIDLAVLNVVLGGGLFLGALALLLLREQPSIGCYPERLTGFWLTFWIGVAGSALAGLGFTASGARGWSVSRRRFVAAVGAASFAWGFEVHNRVLSDRTSLRGGRLKVVAVGNERTTTSWESVSPSAFQMPCAQLTERRACGALSSINALVWPVTA